MPMPLTSEGSTETMELDIPTQNYSHAGGPGVQPGHTPDATAANGGGAFGMDADHAAQPDSPGGAPRTRGLPMPFWDPGTGSV